MLSLSDSEGTSDRLSCEVLFSFFSDTLHYTATNRACQLTEHGGLRLLFYQVWNIISKICFFYTFQLSPSGESVTLKKLVLHSQTGVSCNNWVLMEKNIPSIFLVTFTVGNLGVKLNTISYVYICIYVYIDLYVLITYVLNELLILLIFLS
jgi:hypothetical protein